MCYVFSIFWCVFPSSPRFFSLWLAHNTTWKTAQKSAWNVTSILVLRNITFILIMPFSVLYDCIWKCFAEFLFHNMHIVYLLWRNVLNECNNVFFLAMSVTKNNVWLWNIKIFLMLTNTILTYFISFRNMTGYSTWIFKV